MAFQLGDILVNIKANTDGLKKGISDVQSMGEQTKSLGEKIQGGMKVAAAGMAVVGAGLTLYAKNATDFTVQLVKDSKSLGREIGVSTTEASRLTAAFSRMGIDAEKTAQMFGIFSKNIVKHTETSKDAALQHEKLTIDIQKTEQAIRDTSAEIVKNGDKSGELALKIKDLNNTLALQKQHLNDSTDAFSKLGVSTTDANGKQKDFKTILLEVADKFKDMPNGVDKTAAAMQLFGKSGKDMLPVLNQGSQGIEELEKQADKLGLTLNAKTIGAVSAYVKSQKDLKQSTDAMKIAVGTATAPVLTEFNEKINQLVKSLLNSHGPLHTATVDMLAFGGPVLTGAAGLTAFAANLSTVSGAALMTGARFGVYGLAAAAAAVGVTYLAKSTFDVAEKTGSASAAMYSWQGIVLQHIPVVGFAASAVLGLAGAHEHTAYLTQQSKEAHDRLTASLNAAKGATDNLNNANTGLVGANLAVEGAQNSYNDAVARYGPNSYEARLAAYNLQVAHDNQKAAVDRSKDAVNQKRSADSAVARNRDLANHLDDGGRSANGQKSAIDHLITTIHNFNAAAVAKKVFSFFVEVDKSLLHRLHVPGFASGVQNFMGGMAVVGERGPELAYLPRGTNVAPADITRKIQEFLSTKAGALTPQTVGLREGARIYGDINIGSRADADYLLEKLNRDVLLEAGGGSRT
jgi:hypothetical protein